MKCNKRYWYKLRVCDSTLKLLLATRYKEQVCAHCIRSEEVENLIFNMPANVFLQQSMVVIHSWSVICGLSYGKRKEKRLCKKKKQNKTKTKKPSSLSLSLEIMIEEVGIYRSRACKYMFVKKMEWITPLFETRKGTESKIINYECINEWQEKWSLVCFYKSETVTLYHYILQFMLASINEPANSRRRKP